MRRERFRTGLILVVLIFLIASSSATMSYDIVVDVSGTGAEIHRYTSNLTMTMTGLVTGVGNFSRLTHIQSTSGIKQDEATSSTKKGNLSYQETKSFLSREGPVIIGVVLKSESKNLTPVDPQPGNINITVKSESADVNVQEYWPAILVNYNKIEYKGPEIRARERYENNGDIIATSIDSWDLIKQSLYRTSINKTVIDLHVIPGKVVEDIAQNKTSLYALESKSTGALTHLDLIKGANDCDSVSRVSEDYRGQQTISLTARMNGSIRNPKPDYDWIPCCAGGWDNMEIPDQRYYSAKGFFDSIT
jgi:hypothetical protein